MRWVRRLLQAALLLLLLAGVAAAGFRAAMHYAPEYRERLVAELETRLQADVEIGRLNLAWEGFGPAVSMQEVRLQAADAAPLRADALRVGLDPLRLLRGQLQPRRITIDGAEVVVHHAQGRWQLRGLPTTLVLDAAGREVLRIVGERDWASPALIAQVRQAIAVQ